MLNSSLIKQKCIIKQPEKPQRTASGQDRAAIVEQKRQLRSKMVHKNVKEKQEKESSNHNKSKQKKTITAVLGSTKGPEKCLPPKIAPLCLSTLPSNIIKCKIFFFCCKSCPHTSLAFLVLLIYLYVSCISSREEHSRDELCSCASGSYG